MTLDILHVPGCPGAAVLRALLPPILAGRPDIQVAWSVISSEDQARQHGMTGSPTLLLDGTDMFPRSGQQPSLSCRLYPGDDGHLGAAPSAAQLGAVLPPP